MTVVDFDRHEESRDWIKGHVRAPKETFRGGNRGGGIRVHRGNRDRRHGGELPVPIPQTVSSGDRRHFGSGTLAALVVANMIGAGVFTTSGFTLADLGSSGRVLAAWVVGGAIAICGAIGYGALARRLTESGGEYLFLSRVLHPAAGFVAGWISLIAGFTGAIAFAAHAFESYVRPADSSLPPNLIAVAVIVVAAAVHAFRARAGAFGQNGVVAAKLLVLAGFVGFAVVKWAGDSPSWPVCDPGPFSLSAFAGSLVWISLSYSGFNAAIYVAGEARDPARVVPRAMLRAALGVTFVYLALNLVFVGFVPYEDVVGRPDVAFAAASSLLGDAGAQIVRAIVALSLLSSVSSMIMAGPRVFAKMADDGVFPAALKFRGKVPTGGHHDAGGPGDPARPGFGPAVPARDISD